MTDTEVITTYISIWGWHLIAVMFFLKAISFLVVHEYVWMMGLVGVFLFAEYISTRRKRELEDEYKE